MNKLSILAILLSSVAFSPLASADNQTVTLGYAQSKVQDFKDIKGVNLKYRYEWDSSYSLITSFTYMSGKQDSSYLADKDIMNAHSKLTYYSLSVGPAYRFNDFISLYGLIGVNYSKGESRTHWNNYESGSYRDMGDFTYTGKKASLMYGVGLQINPASNWAVDVGYEGSSFNDDVYTRSINGFNIGVGYRF